MALLDQAKALVLKPYQTVAVRFCSARPYTPMFMETGTGKTVVSLQTMVTWLLNENIEKFLVVAPNTVTPVWPAEIEKWSMPFSCKVFDADGSAKRILQIEADDWNVGVINYEALRNEKIVQALIAAGVMVLVLDELQRVKNKKSKQTIGCRLLASKCAHVLGLTGTPVTHSPLDLWSEFDVLSPQAIDRHHPLGYGNFYAFTHGVADVKPHFRLGMKAPIYSFPDEKLARLKSRVAPLAIEARKKDVLSLPPRSYHRVPIPMTPKQSELYEALRDDYIATLEGVVPSLKRLDPLAEFDLSRLSDNAKAMALFREAVQDGADLLGDGDDRTVSVNFAATLKTRLAQITAGHIKSDDGTVHTFTGGKEEWLDDNLPVFTSAGWGHKCVIFTRFVADIDLLENICKRHGIKYVTLTGRNSKLAGPNVKAFQTDDTVRCFIGNIATAAEGITLTAGDRVIFYSNSHAWGQRAQAEDRTYRIGQEKEVEYYDLVATSNGSQTVDHETLRNLDSKTDLSNKTVRDLKDSLRRKPAPTETEKFEAA